MRLWTDAISDSGYFDPRYTCDIDNSSPELRWGEPPPETAGFALIADDPDALGGTLTHWVIYNIPKAVSHLPAGIPPQDSLPIGIKQGINSFGKLGYAGPCPPRKDSPHRYQFRLFALSLLPVLPSRLTAEQLVSVLKEYVILETTITGLYQRQVERAG
ncbi:MAG: hypothetical protein A3K03_12560 [Bdellovibrionales bacterium RIFOXYD1_FULL_44_7]|nr:MAG: hypothetical protein A3K03_12560 [Bdellovibrionales bacterium RIFOXYD1_FULL_44_7]